MSVRFVGFGKAIGATPEPNSVVAARLGISEDSIFQKTGIRCRWIAKDESATDMAEAALREAMGDEPPDALVIATFSGDYRYPSVASALCERLNLDIPAYDINANCAGFQVGLSVARNMILADDYRRVGVVGVAKQSPYLDLMNPDTAMFFSDGAGAVVLERGASSERGWASVDQQVGAMGLGRTLFHMTHHYEAVRMRGGGSSCHDMSPVYEQASLVIWKDTIRELPAIVQRAMASVGWDDVDLVLFHQANLRLIEFVMNRLRLPMSKTVTNVGEIGNTADASLATVLYDARDRLHGRVILASVGAGFLYAATPYQGDT